MRLEDIYGDPLYTLTYTNEELRRLMGHDEERLERLEMHEAPERDKVERYEADAYQRFYAGATD